MKWVRLILVLLPLTYMTGCMDRIEIDDQAHVIALGVDRGQGHLLDITLQIANPQVGTSPTVTVENEPPYEIITFCDVPDLVSIRDLANAIVTRNITYTHMKTIIFGEEMARSHELIELIDSMVRDREIRRDINMIVSRERASDFIRNNKPRQETRHHKYYQFMVRRWEDTGLAPASTLHRFLLRTEEGEGAFLAIYASTEEMPKEGTGFEDEYLPGQINKQGGNPTQIIGSAVFKGGRMIGVLDGEETKRTLTLRPNPLANHMLSALPDPINENHRVSTRINMGSGKKIRVDVTEDTPKIQVHLPLDVEVLAIPSLVDYVENKEMQKMLKEHIEKIFEEGIQALVKKTQEEFEAEPFEWVREARKEFATIDDFRDYRWIEVYPKAVVEINVEVKISSFGRQLSPTNLERERN